MPHAAGDIPAAAMLPGCRGRRPLQRWARLRRPEDWPPYNIHKIKPRPGNVFHIVGAGLFKIQDMNRSFRFLKKFLRFS